MKKPKIIIGQTLASETLKVTENYSNNTIHGNAMKKEKVKIENCSYTTDIPFNNSHLEMTKEESEKGFVRNCTVYMKKETYYPYMFRQEENGRITPFLDGFTIIPTIEFERLKSLENEKYTKEQIRKAFDVWETKYREDPDFFYDHAEQGTPIDETAKILSEYLIQLIEEQ